MWQRWREREKENVSGKLKTVARVTDFRPRGRKKVGKSFREAFELEGSTRKERRAEACVRGCGEWLWFLSFQQLCRACEKDRPS